MNLVPVKSIPERTAKPNNVSLQPILEDFMRSSNNLVKVDYRNDGYACVKSCLQSLHNVIKYWGFPIRVITRGGDIYLKKEK